MHAIAPCLIVLACLAPAAQDARRAWGPEQALGAPDTPLAGDRETAWASETEDDGPEWLALGFARAVVPTGVRVHETFHPGALVAITATDADGVERELWRGVDPVPREREAGVALVPLVTDVATRRVTLHLASDAVAGWNEVDAVGLHGADGALQWAVSAEASSTYAADDRDGRGARRLDPTEAPREVPLDALAAEHASAAEETFALFVRARATGADAELVSALAERVLHEQRTAPPASPRGFAGTWSTAFGELKLEPSPGAATGMRGTYPGGSLAGEVLDGRLHATYVEPAATGECVFELADEDRTLRGRWRPAGGERWFRWDGRRAVPGAGGPATWLVVLEAPWREGLAAPDLSFGDMLAAVFEHAPAVAVRHRAFADETSFRRACNEIRALEGDVILSIAAHGDASGVEAPGGRVGAEALADALGDLPNLRLVHFSSCSVLAGEAPELVRQALASAPRFEGVSGYTEPVDWMGSALCELTYFELLLARGLSARDAAELLPTLFPLATAGSAPAGAPIPALSFEFLPALPRAPTGTPR